MADAPLSRPSPRTLQLVHRLEFGGAEILAARFARAFGGSGRVVIGCLDDDGPLGDDLRKEGFRVVSFGRTPAAIDVRCVRRLRRCIRDERIELVHAHQTTPFFYALLARGPFRSRPRILFTEHGRFFPDRGSWKRAWLQGRLLGRDDCAVAVGESVRRALATYEGLPWARIEVIHNGIEMKQCPAKDCSRDVVRAELGIPRQAFVVAFVARLDPIKNHALALSALRGLLAANPQVLLLIVGDGPERGALEARTRELGLSHAVLFTGPRSDVARLYAAADAALLTSVSEGIPLTLIEAMAARLPVVATSVGGVPEVVEHGTTGLLVESGDEQGVTNALASLISDSERRARMASAGRERAERLFSQDRMFAEYAALIGMDRP